MTLIEIVLIIITLALCIMVVVLVPTLIAVRRAAQSLNLLSETVNMELKPALGELTGILAVLKSAGSDVAGHVDDARRFMFALGRTGDNLLTINRSIETVTGALTIASAWTTGIKVAGKYMLEQYLNKWGGK